MTAEAMLRTQFKMELIVYTQDSTYSGSLKRKREDEGVIIPGPFGCVSKNVNCKDNEATLKEMMLHLKSYYLVSVILHALPNMKVVPITYFVVFHYL